MPDVVLIAGVVLRDERGRYLLVQEAKPHVHGLWNWPAGHVDPGETLQQAAIREAKEETNFDVSLTEPEPFYKGHGDDNTANKVHLFHAEITGGNLQFQADELLDARWFSVDEIKQLAKNGKTRSKWMVAALDITESRL